MKTRVLRLVLPLVLSIVCAATLAACAHTPPTDRISRLPVIDYGQTTPANGEFVLRYPANQALPLQARVEGNLLNQPAESTLQVSVKRDVYVYKEWISFDGRNWSFGPKALNQEFKLEVPGQADGRSPGVMSARFDVK